MSRIETEKLVQRLVETELAARAAAGTFSGKFACLTHFFGYEGRCSLPTNFDATYCAALGYAAGALVMGGKNGLMATCSGLERPTAAWGVGGYPLTGMMVMERRKGKDKPGERRRGEGSPLSCARRAAPQRESGGRERHPQWRI